MTGVFVRRENVDTDTYREKDVRTWGEMRPLGNQGERSQEKPNMPTP